MFCAKCNLRWDAAYESECRGPEPDPEEATVLRIAKAINGPHHDRFIGHEMMMRLRDHKWNQLTEQGKAEALAGARAAYQEMK